MSLKAKLEAVIYAAEEPVTLAQLAALFATEALEWKAVQEAASAGPQTAPEAVPLLNAEFDYPILEQPSESLAAEGEAEPPTAEAVGQLVPADAGGESTFVSDVLTRIEAGSGTPEESTGEPVLESAQGASTEPASGSAADLDAEAKRVARQRDREVRTILRGLLDELIATYASDERGIEIKEIAGGYRMATKPECHDAARAFVKSLKPALKLSLPALETLAVIAYKQPVTAPEVNEIRGVESSGVFGSLLARKLIATAGRKQVIGRPILYKTTKEFLLRFGLKDVTELPSMEEFEKMAQMEFEEMESGAEQAAEMEAGEAAIPEVDEEPDTNLVGTQNANSDAPVELTAAESGQQGMQDETRETAARADRHDAPEMEEQDSNERAAEAEATPAERSAAEDAPAAPSPIAEQEETETVPHE